MNVNKKNQFANGLKLNHVTYDSALKNENKKEQQPKTYPRRKNKSF